MSADGSIANKPAFRIEVLNWGQLLALLGIAMFLGTQRQIVTQHDKDIAINSADIKALGPIVADLTRIGAENHGSIDDIKRRLDILERRP